MMPAHSLAVPRKENLTVSRRSIPVIFAAVVLLAVGTCAGGLLFGRTSSAVVSLWSLAVGYGLGVVGWLRDNRRQPLPVATRAMLARKVPPAMRESSADIRCNPFFELLSSPSL